MSFHEVLFPQRLAFGSVGGPERRTDIVTLASGYEERNTPWAQSRRRYNAGYALATLDDIHALIAFFEARQGRLYGFRFRDALDSKSCAPSATPSPADQAIGTGDGVTATFQLTKTYVSGGQSYARAIAKPVAGSVRVAVGGVEKTLGTDFTFDTTTGAVTFLSGHIPSSGAITAGFTFDVPVRFDTDRLEINL
ncbi:MAG: DUF2460 domain-containing protein, partial [Alphaproteobacteria bacterium]